MKRFVLSLCVAMSVHSVNAQKSDGPKYNAVFPITNTVSDRPEFVAANVYSTQEYMGKTIYLADKIGLYDSNGLFRELESTVFGSFLSFTYVTKTKAPYNGAWNSGAETTQMSFHPGGRGHYGQNSMKEEPNYAFCYSDDNGLVLYDINTLSKVAVLDNGGNVNQYTSLTVFAASDYTMADYIVIAGKTKFKIYGTLPNGSSGVRAISLSDSTPSYFGINGQKYDAPQQGLNIVVDGQETKKVIVK